jgi:periplasmic divalent cation tolerance protein
MLIGWTTVETREQAETLAAGLVADRLAACVQIDGPIRSHYRWEGQSEVTEEFRLTVKFLQLRQLELEAWLMARHPYQTPQWLVVSATHVAEKYLSWVQANSTPVPL